MFNRNNSLSESDYSSLTTADKLQYLIFLASLAPSSHNTQPWLFKYGGQTIELFANWDRRLKKSDKTGRELYLSLGAALGNLSIAADSLGLTYNCAIKPQPTLGLNPIATVFFSNLSATSFDPIRLKAIMTRRCNRYNFNNQPIDKQTLQKITQQTEGKNVLASVIVNNDQKKIAQTIVEQSTKDAFTDKGFTDELSQWIKPSLKKYTDGMPGYNLGIPWLLSFFMPWAIKHMPLGSSQAKMAGTMLKASQVFVVLSTPTDDEAAWLRCGEIFEKMAVEAEIQNLRLSVLAAPIEIGDYCRKLQKLLHINERPQMFFRLGYCDKNPDFAPRLLFKKIII